MNNLLKKIIISLVLSIIILVIFISILGPLLIKSNDDSVLILLIASLHFTIIICTLFILDKINSK